MIRRLRQRLGISGGSADPAEPQSWLGWLTSCSRAALEEESAMACCRGAALSYQSFHHGLLGSGSFSESGVPEPVRATP